VGKRIADYVWQKLSSEIQDKKNVYFSADGLLNKIPLEWMVKEQKGMNQEYFRLSSTGELCGTREWRRQANIIRALRRHHL